MDASRIVVGHTILTPRQRVLASLNHQEPDRIPIDFSGHRSSGITAIAYAKLRDHLGLPKRPLRVYDPIQQLAAVDEDVLERFSVDTIELGRAFALEDKYWVDWVLPGRSADLLPGGSSFEQVHNIMPNVPPENVVAMFDAVHQL
jgi:uroporphyrinogen decarboxylase